MRIRFLTLLFCWMLITPAQGAPTLDIYWIDVEGGGATLIVTPAKEAVLIDSGWPGRFSWGASAPRIRDAVVRGAGLSKIDYLVTTHFDIDHFAGAPELARLLPIGTVLDNGIPIEKPDNGYRENFFEDIKAYREFKAEHRGVIQAGDVISLKQTAGAPSLKFRCIAARKKFAQPNRDSGTNSLCGQAIRKEPDLTENANSIVLLLEFGSFKFFDGADLTWNLEGDLVCPIDLVGKVDVYQVNHHGEAISNNPLLLQTLSPTVSIMNNGAHKGGAAATLATLRATPSIQTMYQIHKNPGGQERNTEDRFIANLEAKCSGNYIKCSVDSAGKRYTISIPASGLSQSYSTLSEK